MTQANRLYGQGACCTLPTVTTVSGKNHTSADGCSGLVPMDHKEAEAGQLAQCASFTGQDGVSQQECLSAGKLNAPSNHNKTRSVEHITALHIVPSM